MIFHEVYKIYSKNSLKNNKLLKIYCIISIVFATAILLFTRVLTDTYSSEVKRNMAITNGGDIKIQNIEYNKYYFTSEQIDKLEELKESAPSLSAEELKQKYEDLRSELKNKSGYREYVKHLDKLYEEIVEGA